MNENKFKNDSETIKKDSGIFGENGNIILIHFFKTKLFNILYDDMIFVFFENKYSYNIKIYENKFETCKTLEFEILHLKEKKRIS